MDLVMFLGLDFDAAASMRGARRRNHAGGSADLISCEPMDEEGK